jgi:porin
MLKEDEQNLHLVGNKRPKRIIRLGLATVASSVITIGMAATALAQRLPEGVGPEPVPANQTPLSVSTPAAFVNPSPQWQRPDNSQYNMVIGPAHGLLAPIIGTPLQNWGINLGLAAQEQYFSNPTEGSHPGVNASVTRIISDTEVNLDTLFGIPEARLRLIEIFNTLRLNTGSDAHNSFELAEGDSNVGNEQYLTKLSNELKQFTYEQLFFDDRFDMEAGRLNLKNFMFDGECDQIYLTCITDLLSNDTQMGSGTYGTWGGRFLGNLTPNYYVQLGIEQIDPGNKNTHGWSDWNPDRNGDTAATGPLGAVWMAEIAKKTDFSTTPYPVKFEFGGWTENAQHTDAYTGQIDRQSQGLQIAFTKTFWRADHGQTNTADVQRLVLDGGAGKTLDHTQIIDNQEYVGLDLWGFIPSRTFDSIGIKLTRMQVTVDEDRFLAEDRALAGGVNSFPSTAYYIEADAHIHPTGDDAISIEPDIQYIENPNSIYNPKVKATHSGFIISVDMVIQIGKLLGLGG